MKVLAGDKVLARSLFKADTRKYQTRRISLKDAGDIAADEMKVEIKWTWSGKSFTTTYAIAEAKVESN